MLPRFCDVSYFGILNEFLGILPPENNRLSKAPSDPTFLPVLRPDLTAIMVIVYFMETRQHRVHRTVFVPRSGNP